MNMNILDQIVRHKREEVKRKKELLPLNKMEEKLTDRTRDFPAALQRNGPAVIAELKRKSPSRGLLREDFQPAALAEVYEKCGAAAVSVLTDREFFGGADQYINEVKRNVTLPILRKDFIIDEYQIFESRYLGADAVLLIARILSKEQLNNFLSLASSLKMSCLVEIDSQQGLEKVLDTDARIIGVNNRALDTFHIDINKCIQIKQKIPETCLTVAESGIKTFEDVELIRAAGFDGVLVGESLMRSNNISRTFQELFRR